MKIFSQLLTLVFIMVLSCCGNKVDRPEPILNDDKVVQDPIQSLSAITTAAVYHYICTNNCAGSGSNVQGDCPVCGSGYVHNQAFHDQTNQISPSTNSVNPIPSSSSQNASGTWHYTCPNGCTGGAGSAVACGTCGSILVHNQLYH